MSDPAKSPEEIEDVLASVRRLVSDHGASGTDGPSAGAVVPQKDSHASDEGARLVLTSSFRVADTEAPWASAETDGEDASTDQTDTLVSELVTAEDEDGSEDHPQSTWQPDDRMAEFDIVGDDGSAGDADDGADMSAFGALEDISDDDLVDLTRLDGASSMPENFESDTGDENWPGEGAEAALLTLVARRDPAAEPRASEAESDIAETFDGDDASDALDDHEGLAAAEAGLEPAEVGESLEEDEGISEPESADGGSETDDMTTAEPAGDGADVDDTEMLSAATGDLDIGHSPAVSDDDHTEHDASHQEMRTPLFSRRAQTAGDVDAEVEADDEDTPTDEDEMVLDAMSDEAEGDASLFALTDEYDGILDEETLREIIVDVVREELQGVLGQRITRNVRKLVRREVRLALAAADLE